VARLGTLLERWARDVPLFEAPDRTEEDLEALRSLGYVE
jgi:hypothetical protein